MEFSDHMTFIFSFLLAVLSYDVTAYSDIIVSTPSGRVLGRREIYNYQMNTGMYSSVLGKEV